MRPHVVNSERGENKDYIFGFVLEKGSILTLGSKLEHLIKQQINKYLLRRIISAVAAEP